MAKIGLDFAFDIETQDWDTFVCGCIYDGEESHVYWREDDMGWALLARGGQAWAWNGGLYDALWFSDWALRQNIRFKLHFAGTRITRLEAGRLMLRDACALIPMSLQKASKMVGPEMSKDTGLPCNCGLENWQAPESYKDCGGYCAIRRDMPDDLKASLERYLREDTQKLWEIVAHLFAHAEYHGYSLTATIGGSAWKTARDTLAIEPASWVSPSDYHAARAGYFGGRVTVGMPVAENGYRYDINSAYPYALTKVALPWSNYARVGGELAQTCFDRNRPGIYHGTVWVPPCHLAPLPYRTPEGRIGYPVGPIDGAWTKIEIDYAVSLGAKVLEIKDALVWGERDILFDSFMGEVFRVRALYEKDDPMSTWQKLFGNSLTGKFAEAPEKDRVIVNPEVEEIVFCDPYTERCAALGCTELQCSGRCGAWKLIDHEGRIWSQPYWALSDCAHVQWSAYLTAQTRIIWHKAAMAVGPENVVYGDTDSLYTSIPLDDSFIGKTLGKWNYEGRFDEWLCLAPKTYRYTVDGKEYVRGKGLPGIDADTFRRFAAGETVTVTRGVKGFKSAARSGGPLFIRKKVTRTNRATRLWFGDRSLPHGATRTRASTVKQLHDRERDE